MLDQHIFLIGMAGSGKTSLGKRLAGALGLRFVDTDARVCEMLGTNTVKEIFDTVGEAIFRNAETGTLIELAGMKPCVVSTGGGLPINNENVLLMQNHGLIVFIDRPLDQILSDIKFDRRPNLADGSYEDVINLYNQRIGFYRAAADYRFDNSLGYQSGVNNLLALVRDIIAQLDQSPRLPPPEAV